MTRASGGFAVLAALALASVVGFCPESISRADDPPVAPEGPKAPDPALDGSAIAAVLIANGGRVPATGKELERALSRLGNFAQLPVVFSMVRMDSGLGNPRVVIAPDIDVNSLSDAAAISPSLNGRLFLAANMERGQKGRDPQVTSVEFISWNVHRQQFDFGFIENMGGAAVDPPQLKIVDGGRCFACHKNKGPILGAGPWTNTTHQPKLRILTAERLLMVDALTPATASVGLRDRVDGMALVAPQAQEVDNAVRLGAVVRLNRDTFRMMNRSDGGRKAFVSLLTTIVQPGALDTGDNHWKTGVDQWKADKSYAQFTTEWVQVARVTNLGILVDFISIPATRPVSALPNAPRVPTLPISPKVYSEWGGGRAPRSAPTPPAGGFRTPKQIQDFQKQVNQVIAQNQQLIAREVNNMRIITTYDQARAQGFHGMPSIVMPSNPQAFVQPAAKATANPSGMVNPVMLANTIGLTEGDRTFMTKALEAAAERLAKQKVTAVQLAKQVFEGPEFSDVLAGGALPDRDDFKDRFVAGLDAVITTRYKLAEGFNPPRTDYARAPKRDPRRAEAVEAAVVPTSACLRCHDVRDGARKALEPIPALAFDPFDEPGFAAWLQNTNAKRKQEVLARLRERLHTDADMPPTDSPEHDLFRVKQGAAFDNLKRFLDAELERLEKLNKPDKREKP